jgi:hypothetical protein
LATEPSISFPLNLRCKIRVNRAVVASYKSANNGAGLPTQE